MIQKVKKWWLIDKLLGIVGRKGLKEVFNASKDAKAAQDAVLRSLLEFGRDTVYGREHHFDEILAAASADELFARYEKEVKANDYEDFRPYIERHKNGEADVLFPGKPKMYCTTSGTTKEPKWIPLTERYYQEVIKKMNQIWFYTMIMNKPKVFWGKCLSIVGKAIEGAAPDGTVYGSLSGVSQRDIPGFMKDVYSAPADVFWIEDYKSRYYALMRFAIEQDITLLLTANPSTIVELQTNVNEFWDEYIEDIEKGTLSSKLTIPPEVRNNLELCLKPNPRRAQWLRGLKAKYGNVLPKHYWPNMQVVNTWMCGNTNVYFQKIKDSFAPDAVFHEFAYFSTECRTGVVLKSNTLDTILFGNKIYFEFIHESEIDSPSPKVYKMWEVKQGERYCMLITNSQGLYRYNMNDLLEISGWHNQFPLVKFIQKINGTISLTGEKLHERQFIEAVHEAEKAHAVPLRFFVGFADLDKSNYRFYFEPADQNVPLEKLQELTKAVDGILMKYNNEYETKRKSNRVKEPETAALQKDSFERFKAKCIDMGYRDGQFKLNLLMQDKKRQAMFDELVK